MKILASVLFASALTALAQAPVANPTPPDTVVARIGGRPVTAAELDETLKALPPDSQKTQLSDPKSFMDSFAFVMELAALAEKEHLEQTDATKEALAQLQREFVARRRQILAQEEINAVNNNIPVGADEQKKFYEVNKDRFTEAKVKMLFIAFKSNPQPQTDLKAKKFLTEAEAKAKAEKLLAEARAGADFVKLLKANSDDQDSVARDGDFDKPISRTDKYPAEITKAIFSLKPGQVSEPVRVNTGFYLYRLEDLITQPFEKVRDDIFMLVRQAYFNEWITKVRSGLQVKIENQDYFTNHPSAK